jgi:hypothetical protein
MMDAILLLRFVQKACFIRTSGLPFTYEWLPIEKKKGSSSPCFGLLC